MNSGTSRELGDGSNKGAGGSGVGDAETCQDAEEDDESSSSSSRSAASSASSSAASGTDAAATTRGGGGRGMDAALEHFRRDWRQELEARRRPGVSQQQQPQQQQRHRRHHHQQQLPQPPSLERLRLGSGSPATPREEQRKSVSSSSGSSTGDSNDVSSVNRSEAQEAANAAAGEEADETGSPEASQQQQQQQQQQARLLDLPSECLQLVARWLVGGHQLDYRSLCRLASVCRGFDRLARDRLLWSLIGRRLWGAQLATRDLVLGRAQPLFDGVYIARCSYVRIGERDIGQCYRPCFLVEYYRYLRFLPPEGEPLRGRVQLLTANEPPDCVVPCLAQQPGLLMGEYSFSLPASDALPCLLQCVFHSRQGGSGVKRGGGGGSGGGGAWERSIDYFCDFQVKPATRKGRRNCVIQWLRYEMSVRSSIRDTCVTEFDVADAKAFPAFHFARVRSYTRECGDCCL